MSSAIHFYIQLPIVKYTVSCMCTENLITLTSVSLENITRLWEHNDVLIFLIDLDNYGIVGVESLNNDEKESLEKLKTKHSKKRYIVSRTVLKHILYHLLKKKSILDISTYKDEHGEVHVLDHEELDIC